MVVSAVVATVASTASSYIQGKKQERMQKKQLAAQEAANKKAAAQAEQQQQQADQEKERWSLSFADAYAAAQGRRAAHNSQVGPINVYEKTGNLRTVQTVMGHASMAVTLGYLRGLEVCSLTSEEMPDLNT